MSFHLKNSLLLADCCLQTYEQFHNKGKFTLPTTFHLVSSFETTVLGETNLSGFILQSDKQIIVAFRGTKTDREWISDFTTDQVLFPYVKEKVKVHSGFFSIYQSLRETVFYHLAKLDKGKSLLITGHSLGGALATLFALDCVHTTPFPNISLTTFGAPKVADSQFQKLFSNVVATSFRIVNLYDIVPLLPPNKTEPKYYHTKNAITFSHNTGSVLKNHKMDCYRNWLISLAQSPKSHQHIPKSSDRLKNIPT